MTLGTDATRAFPHWESPDRSILLVNGDCLQVLKTLGEGTVDAVVTDPQYGLGNKWTGGTWFTKNVYTDDKVAWDDKPSDITQILEMNIPAIVWGGNYFHVPPSRCWLSWAKRDNMPTMADMELAWTNLDRPSKEYFHRRNGWERQHPTEKPIALMLWCLGFLPDAETILDPYLGSGTTAVACIRTKRRCIGIELSEEYFQGAVERCQRELDRHPLFDRPKLRQGELI